MSTKILVVAVTLLALLFVVAGCQNAPAKDCPACAAMEKSGTGWCDECGEGMVDGKRVECKGCYEAMTGGAACPVHGS